jgi:hypothetical protein
MPNVRTALLPAPAPIKESVRAEIRVMVKRMLGKYGHPPDKQEKPIRTRPVDPSALAHRFHKLTRDHPEGGVATALSFTSRAS